MVQIIKFNKLAYKIANLKVVSYRKTKNTLVFDQSFNFLLKKK